KDNCAYRAIRPLKTPTGKPCRSVEETKCGRISKNERVSAREKLWVKGAQFGEAPYFFPRGYVPKRDGGTVAGHQLLAVGRKVEGFYNPGQILARRLSNPSLWSLCCRC